MQAFFYGFSLKVRKVFIYVTVEEPNDYDTPPPDYLSGGYESVPWCIPTVYESHCFSSVLNERKKFSVRDRLLTLTNLPKSATITETNMISWITKLLTVKGPKIPFLDLTHICNYKPEYGFKLSIDSASNIKKGFTVAVTSLSEIPFILNEPLPERVFPDDLTYSKTVDPTSKIAHPKWNDGFKWYRYRQLDQNFLIIIELFDVSLKKKGDKIVSKGWTVKHFS